MNEIDDIRALSRLGPARLRGAFPGVPCRVVTQPAVVRGGLSGHELPTPGTDEHVGGGGAVARVGRAFASSGSEK